ncbi:hypothetical protein C6N75_19070 [Streptomyces solincola]|uniref:Uncharacterized protein n=1 Tax=Streptomyces solincola TaxID=2100817 RepID=A0A2S9PT96_9ACTN|nr:MULTISPECIES: hypothetical protein [Streptomyces]PRH77646.1 hypothetical protein C6N75_19070 [Streptomyces solincola]
MPQVLGRDGDVLGTDSVASTAALLRAELPRLEQRKADLEQDLAAVSARLDAVRTALGALQALSAALPAPRKPLEVPHEWPGGLTEQVAAILAAHGGEPMRARDVAALLGRDTSNNAINTVRGTLDRLVATSRAHRAGRGLYQAPRPRRPAG